MIFSGGANNTGMLLTVFTVPLQANIATAAASTVSQFKNAIIQDPSAIQALQNASASGTSPALISGTVTANGIQPDAPQSGGFWDTLWTAIKPAVSTLIDTGVKILIAVVSRWLGIPTTVS